jgi:hypothetical protein
MYGGLMPSDDRKKVYGEAVSCTTWWVGISFDEHRRNSHPATPMMYPEAAMAPELAEASPDIVMQAGFVACEQINAFLRNAYVLHRNMTLRLRSAMEMRQQLFF